MVPPAGDDAADGFQGGDEDCIKEDGDLNVKESIAEALGEFEFDVGEGKAELVYKPSTGEAPRVCEQRSKFLLCI